MLDFKTFEQFNFLPRCRRLESSNSHSAASNGCYRAPSARASHRLSVKYYFAFKKLDALFPNNEWEQKKTFKRKSRLCR